jgi:hypothetical protein
VNHQSFIQIKEIRPSAFTLGTISKKLWKHPRWLVLPRILLGLGIEKLATDMPLLLAQHPTYIYIYIYIYISQASSAIATRQQH